MSERTPGRRRRRDAAARVAVLSLALCEVAATGMASDDQSQARAAAGGANVAPALEREAPDVPLPRSVEQPWMSLAEWRSRHEAQQRAQGRSDAQLVFLGDSITQGWGESQGFRQRFGRHRPLSLGIGGDQTQHVLWRIGDGTLDGLKPRLLVLLIGVNNLGNGHSPDETLRGVQAVIRAVRSRLPETQVLLLAILPAGRRPDDPLRQGIAPTNRRLSTLAEPGHVTFLDVGGAFLEPDGTISADVMADFLHPTASAYVRLTEVVAPTIERLLDRP